MERAATTDSGEEQPSKQFRNLEFVDFGQDYAFGGNASSPSSSSSSLSSSGESRRSSRRRWAKRRRASSPSPPERPAQPYSPPRSSQLQSELLIDRSERHVNLRALLRQHRVLWAQLHAFRKCCACDALYRPLENHTRWGCRTHAVPPAELSFYDGYQSNGTRYPCCGQPVGSLGCVRCAHTSSTVVRNKIEQHPTQLVLEVPAKLVEHELLCVNPEMLDRRKMARDPRSVAYGERADESAAFEEDKAERGRAGSVYFVRMVDGQRNA